MNLKQNVKIFFFKVKTLFSDKHFFIHIPQDIDYGTEQ